MIGAENCVVICGSVCSLWGRGHQGQARIWRPDMPDVRHVRPCPYANLASHTRTDWWAGQTYLGSRYQDLLERGFNIKSSHNSIILGSAVNTCWLPRAREHQWKEPWHSSKDGWCWNPTSAGRFHMTYLFSHLAWWNSIVATNDRNIWAFSLLSVSQARYRFPILPDTTVPPSLSSLPKLELPPQEGAIRHRVLYLSPCFSWHPPQHGWTLSSAARWTRKQALWKGQCWELGLIQRIASCYLCFITIRPSYFARRVAIRGFNSSNRKADCHHCNFHYSLAVEHSES